MASHCLAMLLGLLWAYQSPQEDAILGLWLTEDDEATVEIYPCGDLICGRIIDLKEKIYAADDAQGMAGQAKIDRENPDETLRQRPVIGLVIMEGFVKSGAGWRGGTIYDPDKGKTYRCKMRLLEEDQKLYVRGFVGLSLLGRTTYWRRSE